MVNVKISDLTAATIVATADVLPLVQGGVTKKTPLSLLPVSAAQAAADAAVQAAAIQRANHTGTQSADTITDGTTNKILTTAERSKLAGISAGATANRADTATDAAIAAATAALVNSAPGTLDTLGELASALTSDEGAAATLTTLVGTKAPLASPAFTGTPTIGGTAVAKTTDVTAAVTAQATSDAATYQPVAGAGARLVWLGDSITQGGWDNPNQSAGECYPLAAQLLLGGKGWTVRNAGVGGNNSGQMLARFDTDVTPYKPNVVLLLAGTNDIGQGIPFATFAANVRAIVAKIRAIGATPILATIPPNSDLTRVPTIAYFNVWLARYAASLGAPLIDHHQALTDPATGDYKAGYVTDGTHPTRAGMQVMGQTAAAVLSAYLRPWTLPLVQVQTDTNTLMTPNPLFLTDSNGDGVPDYWASYGDANAVASLVTDTAVPGKMAKITATAATGGHYFERGFVTSGFSAGDTLACSGVITADGGVAYSVHVSMEGSSQGGYPIHSAGFAVTRGVFYQELVIAPGTTTLVFQLSTEAGTGFVQLGQFTVINLTTSGLLTA